MQTQISKEDARIVVENGIIHGSGTFVKDCLWTGIEHNGKFYISLNGETDHVYETTKEDMLIHCNDDYDE